MTHSSEEIQNHAASTRQRLLNISRQKQADFTLVLKRYAAERFLYRLGVSEQVDQFVLKGASMFLVWAGEGFRPTKDVDLLSRTSTNQQALRTTIETICTIVYPEDGLEFDVDSIRINDIREDNAYGGLRVKLNAFLGETRIPLQVDVGFGDAITPECEVSDYPILLAENASPHLWVYPRESFVSEKLEAMVRYGLFNSRMKDFWDVAALAKRFDFDGETLRTAIEETFRRRITPVGERPPIALSPAFYQDPQRVQQWNAFQNNLGEELDLLRNFDEIGELVIAFLKPVYESLLQGQPFTLTWLAGGPWQPYGSS